MTVEENWGWKIRELRKQRGMNLSELAKHSRLSHAQLSKIERGISKKPQQSTFEKIAIGLNMTVDMLIKELRGKSSQIHQETPNELLRRASATMPIAYPVYDSFVFAGVMRDTTSDYHYIEPTRAAGKNIEVLRVSGHCLEPEVNDGAWIAIDRDGSIDSGDIVIYLVNGGEGIGKARTVDGELWFENNERRVKYQDCQRVAPVIEVIRRLK